MKKKKPQYIEYEDGTRVELDEDDVPELTEEDFKRMRPAKEVFEEKWGKKKAQQFLAENAAHIATRSGRPRSKAPKKMIAFRFSPDLLARIKASGRGYNARVEKLLRQAWEQGLL